MQVLSAQRAFLVNCSESLILDHGAGTLPSEKATDLQDILLVNLSSLLLKSLEQLGCCKTLKICILADNFLTHIDPLVECVHLVKLDLKGNQISQLPNALFWSSLKSLKLLYLHDNYMSKRNSITPLSSCVKLTALTLYGTPLSLKHNYRHFAVNSIWSLKALDNSVISDEEIVENWNLPSKFKRMAPHFSVNLCPSLKTDSYKTEMKVLQGIIAVINRIQANYCPILIIQKWIRGHLTRIRLGLCQTAQPLRVLQSNVTPASSPLSPRSPETNRRFWNQVCKTDQHIGLKLKERDSPVERLFVNFNNLMNANSQEETMSIRSFESEKLENLRMPCNTPDQSNDRSSCTGKLKESERDIPGMESLHDKGMDKECFHLFGFKAILHSSEPFAHMLISRKTAGQEVRDAIDHFHSQKLNHPYKPQPRLPNITAEKHSNLRRDDCFSLVPFRVFERADWATKKAEDLKKRVEKVAQLQCHRDDAHRRRDNIMEAWRSEVTLQQDRDKAEIEKALSLQRAKYEQEVQLARQKHLSFLEEKKRRMMQQEMIMHFSRKHSSLGKAITRHCIQQRFTDAQNEKRRLAAVSRQEAEAQKLLIQQYLENRNQNVHAEAVESRQSMHTFLSKKQENEVLEAQARVAHVKSSHYKVEVLHPEPQNQLL